MIKSHLLYQLSYTDKIKLDKFSFSFSKFSFSLSNVKFIEFIILLVNSSIVYSFNERKTVYTLPEKLLSLESKTSAKLGV